MPEIIVRPERVKRAARLKCRFTIDACPQHPYWRERWERELEKAKYKAASWFVEDMAKEGWEYCGSYPWRFRGPLQVIPIIELPKRSQQRRWHMASRELIAAIIAGYKPDFSSAQPPALIKEIAPLEKSEKWEYELSAVFFREEMLLEVPTPEEEKEMLVS